MADLWLAHTRLTIGHTKDKDGVASSSLSFEDFPAVLSPAVRIFCPTNTGAFPLVGRMEIPGCSKALPSAGGVWYFLF